MKGFKGRGSKKGKAKERSGGEQYSGGKRSNKGGKRCGGKCWYCHVEGHPWFKCRKLPDGWRPGQPSIEGSKGVHGAMGEGMGSEEGDGGASGHGGMFYHIGEACSEDMVVPASKVALHRSSHWVIDTGAFMTMSNREDLLDEFRPSKAATVVSATGQVVPEGMKMEMMGTKVFKASLDGRVLWDLRGGKDMHQSMWEITVLPWKEAAVRLAASGGGGDGDDGGLLVHGEGALPSVTPSTGETDWLAAHRRFGHVALPQLQQLFKEERVKRLRINGEPKEVGSCETCLSSKLSQFPFYSVVGQSSDLVELVHVDLVGPMKVKGDESSMRVKAIRSDRGGEFRSWLKRHGIKQQLTTAYTPQSNGVAERANRTIIEGGRMILVDSGLPLRFWPLAIRHATVIKNRVLTHVGGRHWVPMEKWSGKKPLVDMLRVFRCMGLVHVPKEKRDKLQAAAVWDVQLGLARGSKGWLMWDPKSNTIFTTRDAKFMEGLMFKEWSERGRSKVTIPFGIEVGTNDPLLIPIELSSSSELTEVSHDLGGAEGEAADVEEVMQQGEAPVAERGDTEEDVQQPTPSPKLPPRRTTQGKRDAVRGGAKEGAAKERPKRALEALGFKVSGCDESLFMTEGEEEKVFLLVYIDDILLFSPSLERIKKVQGKLKETFLCKALGPVGYYLGLAAMGEKFGLEEGRSVMTPLPSGFQLHLDEEEGEVLEYELQCRFQSMVRQKRVEVLKEKGGRLGEGKLFLTCFADATWASEKKDSSSVGGYICVVGGGPVSWRSKKQTETTLCSVDSEYIAMFHGVKEVIWFRRLLEEIGQEQKVATLLFCDSKGALGMARNDVLHGLNKHMGIKWHWLRKKVKSGTVNPIYIKTHQQPTDFLTKRLADEPHWH
ncbi:unnamed protein product [Closterium sp. NIES-53]